MNPDTNEEAKVVVEATPEAVETTDLAPKGMATIVEMETAADQFTDADHVKEDSAG